MNTPVIEVSEGISYHPGACIAFRYFYYEFYYRCILQGKF